MAVSASDRRAVFVLTIVTGSFLLFLVQPMVARLALPLLGGAPNVWNSAMLVFQTLLLAGYAYAHVLSRLPPRRQAAIHLALLLLSALSLPIALADIPPPRAGWEVLWVPALILASVGPVFVLLSAQAPLMQRWYAADPGARDPYPLYAASNLGSFAGLIVYPLLAEPMLSLSAQSLAWSAGFGLLVAFVALAGFARRGVQSAVSEAAVDAPPPAARTMLLWLALSAVPSGLMLSTTTHLTTDIMAMPLLWVIPLGLYLLSFTVAFAANRGPADLLAKGAPILLLLAGTMAMQGTSISAVRVLVAMLLLLFLVAVALHARLYDLRPAPRYLTTFYLVMAMGGALGGVFTALVAPLAFDWVYEHPLLLLAAAALFLPRPLLPALETVWAEARRPWLIALALVLAAAAICWPLAIFHREGAHLIALFLTILAAMLGMVAFGNRAAFVAIAALMMLARGGLTTIEQSLTGDRARSYFAVYTVVDRDRRGVRELLHGTTVHGLRLLDPARATEPTAYYGINSGIGRTVRAERALFGRPARVGVVGLGTGTIACLGSGETRFTFFEIDPTVLRYSDNGDFVFLSRCAPDAEIAIGDARLRLQDGSADRFDILALDAFSSDAIPLHLLTREAFAGYDRALAPGGVLMVHISNRYIDVGRVVAGVARDEGWHAMLLSDHTEGRGLFASEWVAMSRDPDRLDSLRAASEGADWQDLPPASGPAWSDDRASIVPFIRWRNLWSM